MSLTIKTGSWRHPRASSGVPVVVSLTRPDYAKDWPQLWPVMPRWTYFRAPAAEFDSEYLGQLDRYGPDEIRARLTTIVRAAGRSRTAVLLCWEPTQPECHRGLFATWWHGQTGETVTEAAARKVARGQFRLRDGDGRQILMFGKYSYAAPPGLELAPGDWAVLPGNRFRPAPRNAQVTSLGSDYAGPLVEVLGPVAAKGA